MNGIELIAAERKRQVEKYGWSSDHDDDHKLGELLEAAVCYMNAAALGYEANAPPLRWPWEGADWKPKDTIRNLVRGLALGVAELDRLLRLEAKPKPPAGPLNHDHDEARSLHRIVRAMHDGECPRCHKIYQPDDMRPDATISGWECPGCGFAISQKEGDAAVAEFAQFMESNLAVFEAWRERRKASS